MAKKRILIIEDQDLIRLSLQIKLEGCGFEVYSAGNAKDARHLAALHWKHLDVAVLDMRLEDPQERDITGAGIAIEFREGIKSFPPESLIYSVYSEIDYYRLALRLGAAAYLSKTTDDLPEVVQHVRVLALRRALNGENPNTADAMACIAMQSESKSEAVERLCQKVLKPEFEACLGVRFIILFTEGNITKNCSDNADLPAKSHSFYDTLQALAHGKGNVTEPFVFEANGLEQPQDEETARLYKKLNNAAFFPLSLSNNLRLSIGILQDQEGEADSVPASALALSRILAQYLRPTVLENVMTIWSRWTELRATRTSIAKLCLSVGQEIKDSVETNGQERLEQLAEDLDSTGQLLNDLNKIEWGNEKEVVSIGKIISTTWDLIIRSEQKPEMDFGLDGDCRVYAQRNDIAIIISRMLQWFAYRSLKKLPDVKPAIKINCETTDDWASITFEDNSPRLPKKLRDDMFAPFTQAISTPFGNIQNADFKDTGRYLPLYVAKMLVEGRYEGSLRDCSDDIQEHSYGHRLVMQFPALSQS